MTGKELADQLFEALAKGTPGDDPALVDRLDPEIAALTTDEMWRFVYVAGTRGVQETTHEGFTAENCITTGKPVELRKDTNIKIAFAAFNAAIAKRPGYKTAIVAMYKAPKPAEWPPAT